MAYKSTLLPGVSTPTANLWIFQTALCITSAASSAEANGFSISHFISVRRSHNGADDGLRAHFFDPNRKGHFPKLPRCGAGWGSYGPLGARSGSAFPRMMAGQCKQQQQLGWNSGTAASYISQALEKRYGLRLRRTAGPPASQGQDQAR